MGGGGHGDNRLFTGAEETGQTRTAAGISTLAMPCIGEVLRAWRSSVRWMKPADITAKRGGAMNDTLLSLKEENKRLNEMVETDWLTGLYNRMAIEKKVNEVLKNRQLGVLLAIDIDNFKEINDRYGHIAGDRVLQGVAGILSKMVFPKDILARVGGDEFVIFMPISQDEAFIESRCQQIEQRFFNLPRSQFVISKLSLTVCGSSYQPGDNYSRLFNRADHLLLNEKGNRKKEKRTAYDRTLYPDHGKSLKVDMEQISRELSEPGQIQGAFCQDYESFVNIYRFMERRLKRIQSNIYSMLFTLTDKQGNFPVLQESSQLMEDLHEVIQSSLRSGDVFTRYSSCQFLLMVCDASGTETDSIAERILNKFNQHISCYDGYQIRYNRYPLKPVFSTNKIKNESASRQ